MLNIFLRGVVMQSSPNTISQQNSGEMMMTSNLSHATALPNRPARRQLLAGAAISTGALFFGPTESRTAVDDAVSHSAESIHQEISFKASNKRVYDVLTDAKQFEQVVHLSDAMKSRIPPNAPPTRISTEPGGAFSTFGGLIVGMQIELVPNERIVQAWRPAYWKPGSYSIVRFVLTDADSGTKITLDHRGFPDGDGQSLLDGWNKNYWEPLAKFLAQP
jgi:activator of HSP90 ATPase